MSPDALGALEAVVFEEVGDRQACGATDRMPEEGGCMQRLSVAETPRRHHFLRADADRQGEARRHPLAKTEEVGNDTVADGRTRLKQLSTSSKPSEYLIEDQQDSVGITNLTQGRQPSRRWTPIPSPPLNGLDQDGRWKIGEIKEEGLAPVFVLRIRTKQARERGAKAIAVVRGWQDTERHPVVAALKGQQLAAAGRHDRCLDCGLDGFGARCGEDRLAEAPGGQPGESRREFDTYSPRERVAKSMNKLVELAPNPVQNEVLRASTLVA